MFYVNPHDWQENARVVGEESIAGERTDKLTADVLVDRAVRGPRPARATS